MLPAEPVQPPAKWSIIPPCTQMYFEVAGITAVVTATIRDSIQQKLWIVESKTLVTAMIMPDIRVFRLVESFPISEPFLYRSRHCKRGIDEYSM